MNKRPNNRKRRPADVRPSSRSTPALPPFRDAPTPYALKKSHVAVLALIAGYGAFSTYQSGLARDSVRTMHQDVYDSLDDCRRDWNYSECEPSSTGGGTASSSGGASGAYWYGPYYTDDNRAYRGDGTFERRPRKSRFSLDRRTESTTLNAIDATPRYKAQAARGGFGRSGGFFRSFGG